MSETITNSGVSFIVDVLIGNTSETISQVAVGSGENPVQSGNTVLQNELYRGSDSDPNVTIEAATPDGQLSFNIEISGGSQVPIGANISEFGLFSSNGTLLYHETKDQSVIVGENDTVSFAKKISFIDIN